METGGTSGKGTCSVEKKHDSFGETLGMGHCALYGILHALKVRLDGFGRCWLQERAGWALIKGLVHCEPDNLKFYKF